LDKKFAALDTYHKTSVGLGHSLAALAASQPDYKTAERYRDMASRLDALRDAENELDLFLSLTDRRTIFNFRKSLLPYLGHSAPGQPAITGPAQEELDAQCQTATLAANEVIKDVVNDLLAD
jgi:hypothetical protein